MIVLETGPFTNKTAGACNTAKNMDAWRQLFDTGCNQKSGKVACFGHISAHDPLPNPR